MRVLHLVARSQRRGAEQVALDLADALDRLGHHNQVLAVARGFDGSMDPALSTITRRTRIDALTLLLATAHVRTVLRRRPVDVVLAHGGSAVQIAAVARGRRRQPVVVWQRILGFPPAVDRRIRRRWWRWICRRTDAAVALTPDLERELRDLGFAGPVWEIPNFRPVERFAGIDRAEAARSLRAELGVGQSTRLLGLVGHLSEQKRPDRALEVLARVRASRIDAHLVVAGDGPLRPQLEALVRDRGLERSVHFLGQRTDVDHILGGLDLMLLTSAAEGIPGSVIEAQMTGCPVVTFAVGGVGTVVEDDKTGIVLPESDVDPMATAVSRLLGDDARLLRYGAEARRRGSRFSTSAAAAEYSERLLALIPETPAHAGRSDRR